MKKTDISLMLAILLPTVAKAQEQVVLIGNAQQEITSCDILFYDDGGADGNYKAPEGYYEKQTIIFRPMEGNVLRADFLELNLAKSDIDVSCNDMLSVYSGTEVYPGAKIAEFGDGDYTGKLPAGVVSNSEDGSLTFQFQKSGMCDYQAAGWKIRVYCDASEMKILSKTPADKAKQVKPQARIAAVFSQPIAAGDLSGVVLSPDPGGVSAKVDGYSLVIEHDPLKYSTEYTVSIPGGAVDGYAEDVAWSFTTMNEGDIVPDDMVFMKNTHQNVTTCDAFFYDDGGADGDYSEASKTQTVTFHPGGEGNRIRVKFLELNIGENIYESDNLSVYSGGDVNASANLIAAFSGDYTGNLPADIVSADPQGVLSFKFTKGKYASPASGWKLLVSCEPAPLMITEQLPAAGEVITDVEQPLTLKFNKNITLSDASLVTITPDPGNVSPVAEGNVLVISHAGLDYESTYTVDIRSGAIEGSDASFSRAFVTGIRPQSLGVLFKTPADGAKDVAITTPIALTFNEEVTGSDLSRINITPNPGTVRSSIDRQTLTIDHSNFKYGETYTVGVPAGTVAGFEETVQWSFTIQASDGIAPKARAFKPAIQDDRAAINEPLTVTFDRNVAPVDLSKITIEPNPGGVSATLKNKILTISHQEFESNVDYTVSIPSGAISDFDGCEWSFTTHSVNLDDVHRQITTEDIWFYDRGGKDAKYTYVTQYYYTEAITFIPAIEGSKIKATIHYMNAPNTLDVLRAYSGREANHGERLYDFGYSNNGSYPTELVSAAADGSMTFQYETVSGGTGFDWAIRISCTDDLKEELAVTDTVPAANATEIPLDQAISVVFNNDIVAVNLENVRISPNPGNVVASVEGNKLTIAHDKLAPSTTYTVNVPLRTIRLFDDVISWSFTTTDGTGVMERSEDGIRIIPSESGNRAFVAVHGPAEIRVVDLTGKTVSSASLLVSGEVEISDVPGIYIVQVKMGDAVHTQKMIVK